MQSRTKYWLGHCEIPHSGHEIMMQCERMFHDKFFWMTMAWGFCVIVMIGLVVFLAFTTPQFAFMAEEMIPFYYPFH